MADKKVQRKKLIAENRRLQNILDYSKVDDNDRFFIEKCSRENERELNWIN